MPYDAVLFDNDGVLVELADREILSRGARDAFAAAGVAHPAPAHVDALAVGVAPAQLHEVCAGYGLNPASFWPVRDRHSSRVQRRAMRAGDVGRYGDVDAIRDVDVPLGVVSSNQRATVAFAHDHFDIRSLFGPVVARPPTLAGLRRKKPAPHYVERALAALGVGRDVLFVGDSAVDVRAAERAGLDSAFLRRPHRRTCDLGVEPTRELADLRALTALDCVPTGD